MKTLEIAVHIDYSPYNHCRYTQMYRIWKEQTLQ